MYVFPPVLPPLRERREDIPALVEHFARQVSAQNGWKPIPFTAEALQLSQAHAWPGNVRELRNVVERLLLLATDAEVNADTVQLALPSSTQALLRCRNLPSTVHSPIGVQSFERETIVAELKTQPVAYHQHRQGPRPRTQPPLQESPSIGNRLGESAQQRRLTALLNIDPIAV